jgi:hypothetical protein
MTNVCPHHKAASSGSALTAPSVSASSTILPQPDSIPLPYTTSQLEDLKRDLEALAPVLAWVDDFVTQANPDLGRTGVVCPFVPEATRRDLLQYFVVPVSLPSGMQEKASDDDYIAVMEPSILRLRDRFLATRITAPKFHLLHSYLMVFRGLDLDLERAAQLIEKIQRRLKPRFVEEGLMIGEFHPMSNAIGLRNPEFRPLRSPIPLLSIRNMVEIDFAFLSRSYDPAPLRVHFLKSYLRHMAADLGPLSRQKAEAALEEAESQVLQLA